jgi:ABC-2 type transport system ATP-binding protein
MERKDSGKTTILVTHDMNAVKKYCNKAVLIEKGLVKAIGDPNDVASQYSLDNTITSADSVPDNSKLFYFPDLIDGLRVELLSEPMIEPGQEISFKISYNVFEDLKTYVAFSLTDLDRKIWIYNDNSMDNLTDGKGKKEFVYTTSIPQVNDLKLILQVSIRDDKHQPIAVASSQQSPRILIVRNDITENDFSARDSATGLIQRHGSWLLTE